MAIKGLTDRQAAYPVIGELRKGAKKTDPKRPGKNLTYFRFTSDDGELVSQFYENYPKEPRVINALLPADTAEQNFDAWKEHWVAGGLVHRCDGETCVLWRKPDGGYSTEPKPCPGGCDFVGRLAIIVPELGRLATITVLTTSYHDIKNLSAQLKKYMLVAPGRSLQGIPFIISRKKAMISTPMPDGKRARREEWLLSIETQPEWTQRQIAAQRFAALPPVVEDDTPILEIEGSYTELDQLPAGVTAPFDDTEAPEPVKVRQPLAPEKLRELLHKKADKSNLRDVETGEPFPVAMHPFGKKTAGLVSSKFTEALGWTDVGLDLSGVTVADVYHTCLHYLFGVNSANELTAPQADAILDWLLNGNKEAGFKAEIAEPAPVEARAVYETAIFATGKGETNDTVKSNSQ